MGKSLESISSAKVLARLQKMCFLLSTPTCLQIGGETKPSKNKTSANSGEKNENCKTKAIFKNKKSLQRLLSNLFRFFLLFPSSESEWNMLGKTWFIISIRHRQRHFEARRVKLSLNQQQRKRLSFILFSLFFYESRREFTALKSF